MTESQLKAIEKQIKICRLLYGEDVEFKIRVVGPMRILRLNCQRMQLMADGSRKPMYTNYTIGKRGKITAT